MEKRQRDKEIKAEGMARAKERKGEAGKRHGRTFKSILVFFRLYFSAVSCLVLPPYSSFSVSLLQNKHTRAPAVNPAAAAISGCFLLFKALSPSAALAILPSLTKPLHNAFSKRTDLTPSLHAFSSSYHLMLIKIQVPKA